VGRAGAVAAAITAALLALSGAGGAATQQTPRRGGTVVVALVPPEPACLDIVVVATCAPGSSTAGLLAVTSRVLASSLGVSDDFSWRPGLASVEFTRRRPFTLTYRIRPQARWSDGVPVSARDFLFTLRALRKYDPDSRRLHRAIHSIRAVDPKTVRLVLRPRDAEWRTYFGSILPSHVLRGQDLTKVWKDRIDDPRTGKPIGSGPFLVERWDRGRHLVLRRNPDYWGPHPAYVDRVVVRFGVDGNDLVGWYRGGEVDVAYGFPVGFLADLRREPGVGIIATPGAAWDHFEIRRGPGGHPALRNKLVRRALAYSIDRAALVRQLFAEIVPTIQPSQSAVYLNRSRHYRPNWRAYSFQPGVARQLLAQAGCSRGADGIYSCGGERLSIVFSSPLIPGGFRARVLELVAPQLRQAGIELVPRFMPSRTLTEQVLPSGDFQVAIFGWGNTGPSYLGKDVYGCGGPLNYTGYCQRLVTADLDQAQRILDADQQARVVNRADAQLARDVPVIPLYQQPVWAAVRSGVRGYVVFPTVLDALHGAENWWLER
jgi:peptide/nickel transport system substrate-binding protein